jgi:diguanylate cyclase (GGDEF)-like protein
MEDFDTYNRPKAGTDSRYARYDRIMGYISWFLIALVVLDIALLPSGTTTTGYLVFYCGLLLTYNLVARHVMPPGKSGSAKTFIDLLTFLSFTVAVSWLTGKVASPFISLMYLILMATSLTQGRKATYFMAALAVASYVFLAAEQVSLNIFEQTFVSNILEILPFMLIAHLGAMLSSEAETARHEVEKLSLTDDVTGLHNMRNFFNLAAVQIERSRRNNENLTICMLDADNLKQINDRHGHLAGTEMIRHVARTISRNIRSSDIAARYGGDEFLVMFMGASKESSLIAIRRIVTNLAATPFDYEGNRLSTTISAGVAAFPEDGTDIRTVIVKADEAMYTSKKEGKNRVTVHTTGDTTT